MVTGPPRTAPPGLITSPPTGPAPNYFEGAVGLPSLPAWITHIPEGALLQGVVQGYAASNTYSVLTAQGAITITTALALAPGTQLLFQIGPEIAHHRLHLIGGSAPSPAQSSPISTPAASAPSPLPPVSVGGTLSALVIRPAPLAPPTAASPPAFSPATMGVSPQTAVAAYAPGAAKPLSNPAPSPTVSSFPASLLPVVSPQNLPQTSPPLPTGFFPGAANPSANPSPAPALVPSNNSSPPLPTGFFPSAASPSASPPSTSPPTPLASPASPATTQAIVTAYSLNAAPSSPPNVPANPETAIFSAETTPPPLPLSGRQASSEAHSSLYPSSRGGETLHFKVVSLNFPKIAASPEAAHAASPVGPSNPLTFFREGIASLLSTPNAPATLSPEASIVGMVIANGAQNRPILAVGSAIFLLESAPLPLGTQVRLTAQPNMTTPMNATAPQAGQQQVTPQAFPTYPSLPALIGAAQEAGGRTGQAVLAMLPRLDPQLAAGMMVFITGAVNGDLRTLVGNNARAALEKTGRGRAALTGALQEFEAAGEEARGRPAADWRAITVPVLSGHAEITPIRLYLHQASEEEAEGNRKNKASGQRFLLDLNLSRIGSLQIDGLAKHNQLDLVIRTPAPLPSALRDALRLVFFESVSARGLAGNLTFQTAPKLIPNTGQTYPRSGLIV